ncbi:glutathione-dependent formaldehyde-activating enzyme [Roridomyces roridus]|uniref:Glutathione-dependent formaldehyde-activating enzyme n=1 Tax=Roridomyces roridus TaxID=1738132 RepID=A0AAD7C7V6_9AGAR|nr:glutathione-dependent formaldehyde-activating enzyme [Roridomyces roridus]
MSESPLIEYRGNCHCAAFKFTFKAPEIKQTFACNCSICHKNSYLWGFPPEGIVVVKGDLDKTLKTYEFGNRKLLHKFCPTCGTSVLACKPDGRVEVNLRCLHEFDAVRLPIGATSNLASKEPLYNVPEPVQFDSVLEGAIVYQGSCHCGAIRYAHIASEPLKERTECNCSICTRDGVAWIYPGLTSGVIFEGLSSLTEYTLPVKEPVVYHGFCSICGVSIRERFEPGEINRDRKVALNARTINDPGGTVDLDKLELVIFDGKAVLPAYDAGW